MNLCLHFSMVKILVVIYMTILAHLAFNHCFHGQLKSIVTNDYDVKFRCLYSGKENKQTSITLGIKNLYAYGSRIFSDQ